MSPSKDDVPPSSIPAVSSLIREETVTRPAGPALGLPGGGLLLLAVLLTGATALAYEVTWTRGLVRLLGSTATTTTVVLAAFVGALGLGARWGGRRADAHTRPLLLYGLLEVSAAVWAVLALAFAHLLEGPYVAVAGPAPEILRFALRVLVAALVVMPGAFLLGATLPALVRFWVREAGGAGRGTAWVYGVNTLGAVAGALVTGFYGIEALGVVGWLVAAAAVAVAVGGTAAWLGRSVVAPSGPAVAPAPRVEGDRLPPAPGLFAAALSGAIGLGLEVTGFRILVFFVEGFTATFAAMLGVFIAGLGLGSLLLGPWLVRLRRPDRALGLLLVAVGFTLVVAQHVVLPGLEELVGQVRARAYAGVGGEEAVQAALHLTALAGSAALLFLPALVLGATFPLCVRWQELAGFSPGIAVGRVYLWNSAGALVAPFLVGFVLIPWQGVLDTWQILFVLCFFGGMAIASHVDGMRRRPRLAKAAWTTAAVAVLAYVLVPVVLPGGDSSDALVRASHVIHRHPERKLLAVATDEVTTASVIETDRGERILYTDDFAAAATGRHYRYMRMLGHLPMLLAKNPEHVMVIAFGTGTTAGAVVAHDEVKRLEVVEVSRAVFDLARYFDEANRGVLDDPRTVRVRDDGRNALLLHEPDLDVITLEPLMPYSPAGLPFYTREFYELARDRLRDGGVVCQWMPVHAMPAGLYAALVRTFFEVFPEGSLWFFEQSCALIAVKGDGADREAFERRARAVADDLAAAGFTSPELVLSAYVASGENVLGSPVPPSPWTGRLVTDLDPFPEFHPTPRAPLNTTYLPDTLHYLWRLTRPDDLPPLRTLLGEGAARLHAGTAVALVARRYDALAGWAEVAVRALPADSPTRPTGRAAVIEAWQQAARRYAEALRLLPGETVLCGRQARAARRAAGWEVLGLLAEARRERSEGREGEAQDVLGRALVLAQRVARLDDGDALASERDRAVRLQAAVLVHMCRCHSAREVLRALDAGLPAGSAERDLTWVALEALAAHERGEDPCGDGGFAALIERAPACREEGAALVAAPLVRWREVREGASPRALRLAVDNLVVAARREGVEAEVLEVVFADGAPARSTARAAWAGLLVRLDGRDDTLRAMLQAPDVNGRRAAVAEGARLRLLDRWPEETAALAGAEDATLRIAFADAAGETGNRVLLRLAADLLLDTERSVRTAAAAALYRHVPDVIADYDGDASEARRLEVVEAVRRRLE